MFLSPCGLRLKSRTAERPIAKMHICKDDAYAYACAYVYMHIHICVYVFCVLILQELVDNEPRARIRS